MHIKLIKKNNEAMTPQLQKLLDAFSGKYEETFEKGRFRLKAYTSARMFDLDPYCYLIVVEYVRIGNKWVTGDDFIPHSENGFDGIDYEFLEKNSTDEPTYDSIVFPGKFGDGIEEAADAIVRAFEFTIEHAAESGMDKAECKKCSNDLAKNTAFIAQAFTRMEKHLPGLYPSVEAIFAAAKNAAATAKAPASAEIKSGPHKGVLRYTPAAKAVAKKIGEDLLMAILAAASDEAWSQADESEWKDAVDTDHGLEWNTCQALGWGFEDMGANARFKGDSGKVYSGREAKNAYDAIATLADDDLYSLFFNNQPRNYSHIRDVVATAMDMAADDGEDESKRNEDTK